MQKAPCNRWRRKLKFNRLFNELILALSASQVKKFFFSTPYDRLTRAVATHDLDRALTILERLGCHDPETQIAILAACQRGQEVCDA